MFITENTVKDILVKVNQSLTQGKVANPKIKKEQKPLVLRSAQFYAISTFTHLNFI